MSSRTDDPINPGVLPRTAVGGKVPVPANDDATRIDPQLRAETSPEDAKFAYEARRGSHPGPDEIGTAGSWKHTQSGLMQDGLPALRDGDLLGGRYDLIGAGNHRGPLGQGAFGEVWQARDRVFGRDVALKILQARSCSASALLRFELEKQIIARMEHPNIARVFDAGSLPDGRPFMAMELLRGRTLGQYLEERDLTLRQRLQLFLAICRAVQHAHERLVLHRDLKPSNILVVEHDGQPVPKVIDFGIAKLLEDESNSAGATIEASVKGTPAYMSPEQTRGVGEMTVRSDVYTLGVILYEMLTGDTPLSHTRTRNYDLVELLSAIRTEEPLPPSISFRKRQPTHQGATLPSGNRQNQFSRQLQGDLDVIVLRSLQKEPKRRYETTADLAADIERHLNHDPISARPPTPIYRAAKFLERNRAFTFAGLAIVAALVVTAIISTRAYFAVQTSLVQEVKARDAATAAEAVALERKTEAENARNVAQTKEAEARQARDVAQTARVQAEDLISYMLFDLRQQLEPLGRTRLLASVSEKSQEYFARQPVESIDDATERNRAAMFFSRGHILLAQGDTSGALDVFKQSATITAKRLQAKDEASRRIDAAMAAQGLSLALRSEGKPEEARVSLQVALDALQPLPEPRDLQTNTLLAAAYEQLGEMDLSEGNAEKSLQLFQSQEALLRSAKAQSALAIACEKVGDAFQALNRPQDSLPKFQEEMDIFARLAGERMDDLALRRNLSVARQKLGRALLALHKNPEAKTAFSDQLREAELLVRVDPRRVEFRRDVAVAHQGLASALLAQGDSAGALEHARIDLQLTADLLAEHPTTPSFQQDLAASRFQLGVALLKAGKAREAREQLEQSAKVLRELASASLLNERGKLLLRELEKALIELK